MQELEAQALESGLPLQPLPAKPEEQDETTKDSDLLNLDSDHLIMAL
jgi:hypothetical protein